MPIILAGQAGTDTTNLYPSPGPTISYSSVPGNTLIATGLVYTGAVAITGLASVTDSAGNSWQFSTVNSQDPPSVVASSGGNYWCTFVAWCTDAAAVTSVSLSAGVGFTNFWRVSLSEWRGISSPDNGVALAGTNANPTGVVSLSYPDDLVTGVLDPASVVPSSLPPGWMYFGLVGGPSVYLGYDMPGVAGLYSAKWAMASDSYALAVMSFYSTGHVAPPPAGMRAF